MGGLPPVFRGQTGGNPGQGQWRLTMVHMIPWRQPKWRRLSALATRATLGDPHRHRREADCGSGGHGFKSRLRCQLNSLRINRLVVRAEAAISSGCESHPAAGAPAGSNRSGGGGDEATGASGLEGRLGRLGERRSWRNPVVALGPRAVVFSSLSAAMPFGFPVRR